MPLSLRFLNQVMEVSRLLYILFGLAITVHFSRHPVFFAVSYVYVISVVCSLVIYKSSLCVFSTMNVMSSLC